MKNLFHNIAKNLMMSLNSGNEYREVAKPVAIDILNSDRTEYKNSLKKAEIQENCKRKKKQHKIIL